MEKHIPVGHGSLSCYKMGPKLLLLGHYWSEEWVRIRIWGLVWAGGLIWS